MIKDQIIFHEDYKCFNSTCPVCFKESHLIENCPLINYIPDKDFLIKRLNYSVPHERIAKLRKKKKLNSIKNLLLIQSNALKITTKNEEEKSVSEISSDENEQALSRNASIKLTKVVEHPRYKKHQETIKLDETFWEVSEVYHF